MRRLPLPLTLAILAAVVAILALACVHPHNGDPRLRCIRAHESDTAGGYLAENPTSSASGAYQFLDGTWRAMTRLSGMGREFARASHAPPIVQDAVALWALDNGHGSAWRGTGCPGTY